LRLARLAERMQHLAHVRLHIGVLRGDLGGAFKRRARFEHAVADDEHLAQGLPAKQMFGMLHGRFARGRFKRVPLAGAK
jgi:hypothetical protein